MSAATALASLAATLRLVDGVQVIVDHSQAVINPPALVLVPPKLAYDAYFSGPTEATFLVPLVVQADDRAVERLIALLPAVELALHESEDAALTGADPGNWGSPPLPCYLLTIEVGV